MDYWQRYVNQYFIKKLNVILILRKKEWKWIPIKMDDTFTWILIKDLWIMNILATKLCIFFFFTFFRTFYHALFRDSHHFISISLKL